MSMNVDVAVVEAAVIAQLKASTTQLGVEGYPAHSKGHRVTHPTGVILVGWARSEFSEPVNGIQEETMYWVSTLLIRGLFTHAGAYPYVRLVIDALAGFKPVGCRQGVQIMSSEYVEQLDAAWKWDVVFKATAWYRHAACC